MSKATRIMVLSDTHLRRGQDLPSSFLKTLKSFDLILHLGDFVSTDLVDYFRSLNNFYGIAGNHDPQTVKAVLPREDVVEVNGKRLGLLHGYWAPLFCDHRSLFRFRKDRVDAIVYGHTHVIRNERMRGVLWFNPGSASALWPAPWKTYGILNVGESISGQIVSVAEKECSGFAKYAESIVRRDAVIKWVCGEPRFPDYSAKS